MSASADRAGSITASPRGSAAAKLEAGVDGSEGNAGDEGHEGHEGHEGDDGQEQAGKKEGDDVEVKVKVEEAVVDAVAEDGGKVQEAAAPQPLLSPPQTVIDRWNTVCLSLLFSRP